MFLRKSDEEEVVVLAKIGMLFFWTEENAMDWNVKLKVCAKRQRRSHCHILIVVNV